MKKEEHRGFFCTFSEEFFNADRQNKQFLSELPFFQIDGNAVLHLSDEQMQALAKQETENYWKLSGMIFCLHLEHTYIAFSSISI